MTDLGWGAWVNCKNKLERFLGRDIELEPKKRNQKSRTLAIKDEKKEAKVRALEAKLDEREEQIEKIEKVLESNKEQARVNMEKNKDMLGNMTTMIKNMMGKEQQEQQSRVKIKKELNIKEMEEALDYQYQPLYII